ncbi:MAG TPA: transcription termination factor Rho [Arthrobacter sp.]|nr:transcription termination factor Rho [Arthrobacter sp.]
MTETTDLTAGVDKDSAAAEGNKSNGLAGLKLAQLQALAGQLGITGGSRMRKSDLVAAISNHQRGGAVADREAKAKNQDAGKRGGDKQQGGDNAGAEDAASRNGAQGAPAQTPAGQDAGESQSKGQAESASSSNDGGKPPRTRNRNRRAVSDGNVGEQPVQDQSPAPSVDEAAAEAPSEGRKDDGGNRRGRNRGGDSRNGDNRGGENRGGDNRSDNQPQESSKTAGDSDGEQDQKRSNDSSDRGNRNNRDNRGNEDRESESRSNRDNDNRNGGDNRDNDNRDNRNGGDNRDGGDNRGNRDKNRDRNRNRNDNDDSDGGGRNRNRRNRNRNDRFRDRNDRRGRRNQGPQVDETEITEDDVLVPVAGILDVLENYAFVRTSGYLPGPNDVYVSLAQVKKYNLRKGDAVTGHIRAPRDNENQGGSNRQKFNALVKLDTVNGQEAEAQKTRTDFSKLVPLYPSERLRLETEPNKIGPRVIDLVSPIGKGQRGLIVSPPKAGKTLILQSIANAITVNNPEVHLMMVLVDERPEEVTDMQRTVKGEVIASTFDRPADDHTTVAELSIERAKRLVEMGMDVVVLLDSMTRLGRAYNLSAPASGRILSGGVDSAALYPPKRFFGAARNIENGGSLTILATALVETGSKMDEVIFEEFKGTGNMELRLSRTLADKRIFPAVDVNASSTRREEALLSPDEIKIMWKLRRVLSGLELQQGLELLTNKIKDTQSNVEFLMQVQKTTLGSKNDS